MQIFEGKRKIFRKSAVMAEDAQYGAVLTMRLQATFAKSADWPKAESCAGDIDFPCYAFSDPRAFHRCRNTSDFHNFTDKFVTRRAAKAVIAAKNFDIGVANPCETDFDERPTWAET